MAVKMEGKAPVRKVAAGGIGGAITTVIVWVLNTWVLEQSMPSEVAAALATIVSFALAYFVRPGANERINPIIIPATPTIFPIIAIEFKIISLIEANFWELKKILIKFATSSLNIKKMRINTLPIIKQIPVIT